jgi:hypothetical protein
LPKIFSTISCTSSFENSVSSLSAVDRTGIPRKQMQALLFPFLNKCNVCASPHSSGVLPEFHEIMYYFFINVKSGAV